MSREYFYLKVWISICLMRVDRDSVGFPFAWCVCFMCFLFQILQLLLVLENTFSRFLSWLMSNTENIKPLYICMVDATIRRVEFMGTRQNSPYSIITLTLFFIFKDLKLAALFLHCTLQLSFILQISLQKTLLRMLMWLCILTRLLTMATFAYLFT